MKGLISILVLMLTLGSVSYSQSVKWQRINSESEFAIAFPEGSIGFKDDADFYLSRKARVTKRTFVYRYINGNALMLEMYEGVVEEIRDQLVWRLGLGATPYKLLKSDDASDLSIRSYTRESDKSYSIQQLILFGNRLYVVQGHSASKDSEILKRMLGSVTVNLAGKMLMPNLLPGSDATTAAIPTSIVEAVYVGDPAKAFEGKPDSDVVFVHRPRPRYTADARAQGSKGVVTVKALFGANGRVIKVEPLSGDISLRKIVTAAAEEILFLPAVKDGKAVSIWKTLSYSFEISY